LSKSCARDQCDNRARACCRDEFHWFLRC
jgi:hypothetical protein